MSGLMQRPFIALGLLAMGMAVIPLNDAFIKLMSDRLPLAEIVFVRGVLALLIIALFSRGISSMLELPVAISGSSSDAACALSSRWRSISFRLAVCHCRP